MDSQSNQYYELLLSPPLIFLLTGSAGWCFYLAAVDPSTIMAVLFVLFGAAFLLVLINFFCVSISIEQLVVTRQYGIGFFTYETERRYISGAFIGKNSHPVAWLFNPFSEKAVIIVLGGGERVPIPSKYPNEVVRLFSQV